MAPDEASLTTQAREAVKVYDLVQRGLVSAQNLSRLCDEEVLKVLRQMPPVAPTQPGVDVRPADVSARRGETRC